MYVELLDEKLKSILRLINIYYSDTLFFWLSNYLAIKKKNHNFHKVSMTKLKRDDFLQLWLLWKNQCDDGHVIILETFLHFSWKEC